MNMSPDAWSAIISAFGFTASAIAIVYLAQQTRHLAQQTKVSHDQAAIAVNHTILSSLREHHTVLAQRGLLGFFYDGAQCPPDHNEHREVTVMADTFLDILCSGLHAHAKMPASESLEPWRAYCRDMLERSPVLRERLDATLWPHLAELRQDPGPT